MKLIGLDEKKIVETSVMKRNINKWKVNKFQ